MLLEAIEYVLTPCDPDFRKLGYLTETIATEARRRRCRVAWADHLDRTQAAVREAIGRTAGSETAVVLGGGMLADIPLDALCARFARVILVDVCFPRRTLRLANRTPGLEARAMDVTGRARAVLDLPKRPLERGGDIGREEQDTAFIVAADLVVSANILSQLPIVPLDYLYRRGSLPDPAVERSLGRAIVEDHLRLLGRCRGTVCLVSETERLTGDGSQVVETEDALYGVELPDIGDGWTDSWIWDMAPRPELYPDRDVRLAVTAAILI